MTRKKCTVVWPSVGMIITSNGRSQQTPSTKGRKEKNQQLDRVSCPDTEIQVLPYLGIAVDRVSCPDTDIGVSTTRLPQASCFEKPTRSVPETTTNTCKPQLAGFGFHVLTRRQAPFGPGFMS
jgi:hypothetical protein